MNQLRVMGAALDCVTRFRSSLFPLKNTVNDVVKARNLNSKERKVLYDLVFAWSRQANIAVEFLQTKIPGFSTLNQQEKDKFCLQVFANDCLGSKELVELQNLYKKWCKEQENLYVIALGPLIKVELTEPKIIAQSFFEPPVQYLAFDKNKVDASELMKEINNLGFVKTFFSPLTDTAIGVLGANIDPSKLPKKWQNDVWVMDAGSQFIASIIRTKASDKVLDMCTGKGGKLKYLAMNNESDLYALDIDQKRLDHAKKWLANKKITYVCEDALKAKFADDYFDWILLDAPCSGTGTIRRHPDIIHRLKASDLSQYKKSQEQLLKKAVSWLKPGGILIYATCSILDSENQMQVQKLLNQNNKIVGINLSELLNFNTNINKEQLNNYFIQLLPHIHQCDGFFVATLRKNP